MIVDPFEAEPGHEPTGPVEEDGGDPEAGRCQQKLLRAVRRVPEWPIATAGEDEGSRAAVDARDGLLRPEAAAVEWLQAGGGDCRNREEQPQPHQVQQLVLRGTYEAADTAYLRRG